MSRLKINDLETGDQPLYNEDRSIVLLYNGEIYNSPHLRRDLIARGHTFKTRSDGEVICHLYEEMGSTLFERLDGMYAVALWDCSRRRLVLARDCPGEKPLYYAQLSPSEIVFASEIHSLRQFKPLTLTLDRQAIWDLPTFLWVPEPATAYQEIKALLPGHLITADDDGIHLRPWASPRFLGPIESDHSAIVMETRRVVEEAVRSRLLSDVPVGAFLSAGLDSSIVATIASREMRRLSTFSVAFEDVADPYHGQANEAVAAGEYAKQLGTDHHVVEATARSFRNDLEMFCYHGDQPFAVSSGLGILSVARAAHHAGIKVLLGGDGADEAFGGYSWYPHLAEVDSPGAPTATPTDRPISFQNTGEPLRDRLAVLRGYSARERAWAWHYYAHESEKAAIFAPEFSSDLRSSLRHFGEFNPRSVWQPEEYIAQDRAFYFPNEMLRKVDRMTMAFSVEGRTPFAAPAVQRHAAGLRYSDMIKGNTLKWVLRRAFDDVLPREVIGRPKHGFNVPIDRWLRGEWSDLVDETFAPDSTLVRNGIIRSDAGHTARRMLADERRLNGHTIFSFVVLNRWMEHAA